MTGNIEETRAFTPRFGADGLLPVIAQDDTSGQVLMLAWVNREALDRTLKTGEAHYWSRSRGELWHKGATSGNVQKVSAVLTDCDQDALIYRVIPSGPACHTGRRTCFYRQVTPDGLAFTEEAD